MNDLTEQAPFRFAFSLSPLIDYWNNTLAATGPYWAKEAAAIRDGLADAPELQGAIEDLSVLDLHRELVGKLMSVVFPAAFWETEVSGALVPFTMQPAYVSPRFRELFVDETGGLRGRFHSGGADFRRARLIRSFLSILRECHGMEEDLELPLIRVATEPTTGLDRYFRFWPDIRFMDIRAIEPLKPLTDEERKTIVEHITEPEVVSEILHPENFEFHGFSVVRAVDVTQSELLSDLQWELVGGGSMFAGDRFLRLQHFLEVIFQRSDLCIGLAAVQDDELLMLSTGCGGECNCIYCDSLHVPTVQFKGSLFQKAVDSSRILRVSDLSKVPDRSPMDEQLLREGIRSLLIAPLIYQGELLGVLNVGSPRPSDLGPTQEILASGVLPSFALALKRGLNELNSQVDTIIKQKCTAVHPAVEWRFRKAALSHLDRTSKGESSDMEPIVFRDVYPLFAASDIRGSSEARNRAIQADLMEHLHLAINVLREAEAVRSLPIFSELSHRIDSYRELIEGGLARGDETALINFLRNEFEQVFPLLRGFGPAVTDAMQHYSEAIDPAMGTVYRDRRDFEQSMADFNRNVSLYLDREEAEAQAMFPHYFNKHQTDGVEYLIYVGASMVENVEFSRLHVTNLRLWQLMVACGMAWHCNTFNKNLKVPLEATHLILVNDSPLSIRFRFDEKRFDVDGAYDIAHEIVRSRVDKAMIKGTNERLTQPDRIAVVYSRPDEAEEMHQHIKFMQRQGLLSDDLEWLELDDLQGVQGLKALRITVNLGSPTLAERAGRVTA
ncbi:MAG TPA: GAF domain-containing protein [Desulfomonilaceae bacterium]|nr:GAF domain-containing protein [Desulfomonilaceae bacterium]